VILAVFINDANGFSEQASHRRVTATGKTAISIKHELGAFAILLTMQRRQETR
jgi:hypothetical protein